MIYNRIAAGTPVGARFFERPVKDGATPHSNNLSIFKQMEINYNYILANHEIYSP